VKVKTEEKTGIFILSDAAWQTDRLSSSTESVPGFEDSSDLDIVGAHQQLKNPCEQVLKGGACSSKTAYKLVSDVHGVFRR
jgi:hypothetical protein